MSTAAGQGSIPGALYDGDGTLLAGEGPEMTSELTDALPYKALVRDKPGRERVAVLEHGDRLWLLPGSFGTPPEPPMPLLLELAVVVRRGRKVGLAGRDATTATVSKADTAGEEHGFVERAEKGRRGRLPSPRTGQVHAKVLPQVADEIAAEATRRGVTQGILIEEAWALYQLKSGN